MLDTLTSDPATDRADRDGRLHIAVHPDAVLDNLKLGWMQCDPDHLHYKIEPNRVPLVWLCWCLPVVARPW